MLIKTLCGLNCLSSRCGICLPLHRGRLECRRTLPSEYDRTFPPMRNRTTYHTPTLFFGADSRFYILFQYRWGNTVGTLEGVGKSLQQTSLLTFTRAPRGSPSHIDQGHQNSGLLSCDAHINTEPRVGPATATAGPHSRRSISIQHLPSS